MTKSAIKKLVDALKHELSTGPENQFEQLLRERIKTVPQFISLYEFIHKREKELMDVLSTLIKRLDPDEKAVGDLKFDDSALTTPELILREKQLLMALDAAAERAVHTQIFARLPSLGKKPPIVTFSPTEQLAPRIEGAKTVEELSGIGWAIDKEMDRLALQNLDHHLTHVQSLLAMRRTSEA